MQLAVTPSSHLICLEARRFAMRLIGRIVGQLRVLGTVATVGICEAEGPRKDLRPA